MRVLMNVFLMVYACGGGKPAPETSDNPFGHGERVVHTDENGVERVGAVDLAVVQCDSGKVVFVSDSSVDSKGEKFFGCVAFETLKSIEDGKQGDRNIIIKERFRAPYEGL